jgi:23S rRNA (guanosine2251-2'-O)-methyltransferase
MADRPWRGDDPRRGSPDRPGPARPDRGDASWRPAGPRTPPPWRDDPRHGPDRAGARDTFRAPGEDRPYRRVPRDLETDAAITDAAESGEAWQDEEALHRDAADAILEGVDTDAGADAADARSDAEADAWDAEVGAWDEQDDAESEADEALDGPSTWGSGRRGQLIGPGEDLVAGRRPVEEAFAARREAHRLLVVPERRAALDALVLHATTLRIQVVELEGGTLTSLAGFDGHQGVALVVAERRWATLDEILARARSRGEPPLVLVLDSLEDPQNVGTLLRSAEATGVHGVLFPTRRAAPMTASAIKASAGASEHLLLAPVDDLPGALADLHARGLRIVGTDEDAPLAYRDADLRGPVAIIVGSEGRGVSGPVRRRLDLQVRIPMRGKVASLNAAVAGSVLLFEASAQRPATSVPPEPTPVLAADAVASVDAASEPPGSDESDVAQQVDAQEPVELTTATRDEPTKPARRTRTAKAAPDEPAIDAAPAEARKPARTTRSAKTAKTAKASKAASTAKAAKAAAKAATDSAPALVAEPPKRARGTRAANVTTEEPVAGAKAAESPKAAARTRRAKATADEAAADPGAGDDELLPGEPNPAKPRRTRKKA